MYQDLCIFISQLAEWRLQTATSRIYISIPRINEVTQSSKKYQLLYNSSPVFNV